jgi:hypothetical protein
MAKSIFINHILYENQLKPPIRRELGIAEIEQYSARAADSYECGTECKGLSYFL